MFFFFLSEKVWTVWTEGGRGGRTNERPGTYHVTSGPMRGLEKTSPDSADRQTDVQTFGYSPSMTESAKWGRFTDKLSKLLKNKVLVYLSLACWLYIGDVTE